MFHFFTYLLNLDYFISSGNYMDSDADNRNTEADKFSDCLNSKGLQIQTENKVIPLFQLFII